MTELTFTVSDLRFIDHYIADPMRDTKAAAEKAGLPPADGERLLAMRHIGDEIKYRLERRRSRDGKAALINKDKLEDMIIQIYDRCMQKVAIINAHGVRTGEYKFMPNSAIKALEFFARLRGYDKPQNAKGIVHMSMTLEDLLPLMRQAHKELAEQGELVVMQPQAIANTPSLAEHPLVETDEIPASRHDRTVRGEDVNDVPASVTANVKNIDDFLNDLKKKEIDDN